jgi:hypothetical protein
MSTSPPVSERQVGTKMAPWMRVLGWVAGAPLALLRYVVVTRKCIDEHIVDGADAKPGESGPDMPDYLRSANSSAGLATHRRFSLRICDSQISAEQLATIVSSDPNLVSPWEVLRWELPASERRRLAPGDDVLIRMAGPWNGVLRVIERDAERLRLQTQSGSALKGELELRLRKDDGALLAEIELWERADNRLLAILHDHLGLTSRMQTHTWVEFLQRTCSVSGGCPDGPVHVHTQRESR